jgi:hypothetical protein
VNFFGFYLRDKWSLEPIAAIESGSYRPVLLKKSALAGLKAGIVAVHSTLETPVKPKLSGSAFRGSA